MSENIACYNTVDPHCDSELAAMFERIDDLCFKGRFAEVDAELDALDVDALNTTMLVGWAAITLAPWRAGELKRREAFMERVRLRLAQLGHSPLVARRLLDGLG